MAPIASPSRRWGMRGMLVGLLAFGLLAVGCTRAPKPKAARAVGEKGDEQAVEDTPAPAAAPAKDATAAAKAPPGPESAAWKTSFADATRAEPPEGWRPPEKTLTGKSVGKLYEEVKGLWDSTKLLSDEGKRLAHAVTLDTDLGPVDIELRADWAPNHVRNFLALSRAGYYDGLAFDTMVKQVSDTNPVERLDLVEVGCPVGTGETGGGSIGYWLKPEFKPDVVQDEGIVGAVHQEEADTAATRFYITLSKAHMLNGHFTAFGKVTRGLDVARKIFEQPARQDEEGAQGRFHPVKAVLIRKVTIHTREAESAAPTAPAAN